MEVQNKVGIISVYDSAFAHLPRTTIEHTRIYKKLKEFPYPIINFVGFSQIKLG